RWTLLGAGVVSGTTGTATSIGGPSVALLYQREHGARVRATLSLFLCVGNSLAIAALAAAGRMPARDVGAGLIFLACAAVGLAAAARVRRFLDGGRIRAAVLATAAASAIILIAHSLIP
ncbi:MAG TPA: sulfite exporter TauE/SafE family protein, partial [Streptosporangiaceae bacterium]|nr:sulfite exporter TauE/SafE family protein [Streptosporangiaceae bacterium]